MRSRNLYIFLMVSIYGFSFKAHAQEIEAEITPVEIEIVRERQIVLPPANRYFEKIPPRPIEPIKPEISYQFKAFNFSTPQANPVIRPLKVKQPDPAKIYGGFVSAGYGNFASPYLEAFLNSKQDKNKLIGAHTYYNSSGKGPVDEKNSASSSSGVSVFAQSFGKEVTYNVEAGFEGRSTHFYGYPEGMDVQRDSIRQSFNLFKVSLGLSNSRNTDFSYDIGGDFSYLSDRFEATESTVDLTFKSAYKISEDNRAALNADYAIMSRKDAGIDAKPRSLFILHSFYSFKPFDNLSLQVGAIASLENDTLDSRNFHFYPDVKAVYPLSPSVDLIGTLTGGVERVSLQTLTNENVWLAPSFPLYHTNKLYDFQAGINAKLSSTVLVNAGISFANLKNFYFFVNDTIDQSKFLPVYDAGSTKRTNFFGSITISYADKVRFMLRGDYFSYSTDEVAEAWHRPGYRTTLSGSYNLKKKVLFSMDMIAQGNVNALDPVTRKSVRIDPAFDLNFRIEYFVSDNFSAFLEFNNVTSNNYQVFLYYPVRGFQAMGGITWSF